MCLLYDDRVCIDSRYHSRRRNDASISLLQGLKTPGSKYRGKRGGDGAMDGEFPFCRLVNAKTQSLCSIAVFALMVKRVRVDPLLKLM